MSKLVTWLRFPTSFFPDCNQKSNFYCYIHILLINLLLMIYMCYINHKIKVWESELAVWSDNELDLQDSELTLSGGC